VPHAAPSSPSRRILCVFPHYEPSFGTFEYAYPLTDGVQAFMPPQGLLLIAAILPKHWDVRFIDENARRAEDEDFGWADAVFVSGMHIQKRQIENIARRAHAKNKTAVLGGPSVSACPENYPSYDYLHIGELGDATEELIARLAEDPSRPPEQVVLTTNHRRDMTEFPVPAYELAPIKRYFLGTIQFSSGCPYTCEFCDIPGLYGRVPRMKTPEQITAELDKLLACGMIGSVYFVDDNFVANRRALKDLLPHLIDWQKRNGYALSFACEATLNIARSPEILELMREAAFITIFCGIETPDPEALVAIDKGHNMHLPILDAIKAINDHGMEVVSGIIMGLDTDTPETGAKLYDFIDKSKIAMATINLLQALPRTPLWDRLIREGRLREDETLESNVAFRMPYDTVLSMWRECMTQAYRPDRVFERYAYHVKATFANRLKKPVTKQRVSPASLRKGLHILAKIFWKLGVCGDYRKTFWNFALPCLARGDIEAIIAVSLVSHHLIMFARDATEGRGNASHYSAKMRMLEIDAPVHAEV